MFYEIMASIGLLNGAVQSGSTLFSQAGLAKIKWALTPTAFIEAVGLKVPLYLV